MSKNLKSVKNLVDKDHDYHDTLFHQVHPLFKKYDIDISSMTIMGWSVKTGIRLKHLIDIVQGTAMFSEEHKEKLSEILPPELIDELTDYNIINSYDYIPHKEVTTRNWEIVDNYPVENIRAGDILPIDGEGWIRISSVRQTDRSVTLFSNGVLVGRLLKINNITCGKVVRSSDPNYSINDMKKNQDISDLDNLNNNDAIEEKKRLITERIREIYGR